MRWEQWIDNSTTLEKDFSGYIQKKVIRKGATTTEVQGHLTKAKRNLLFSRRVIDEFQDFYEWTFFFYSKPLIFLIKNNQKNHKFNSSIFI